MANEGNIVWRGSREIEEQPGSPRRVKRADGIYYTRIFRGPYEKLLAEEPAIGDSMDGIPASITVDEVEIVPLEADLGEMIIQASQQTGSTDDDNADALDVTYEIDYSQIEKPIQTHPRYAAISTEQWEQIMAAVDDPDAAKPWEVGSLADEVYTKLRRGVTSYIVPAPLARITTRTPFSPNTTAVGKRGNPPGFGNLPSGYEWLQTADRTIRQGRRGRWERVQEWTGADEWDEELYEDA